MTMGIVDSWRMMRHTSSPDSLGSIRSRSTSDGRPSRNRATPRSPSAASCTWKPSRSSEYWMLSASDGSSSTTRTVGTGSGRVVRGVGELTELPSEQEADLLADVHCMVADALQLPSDHVHLDPPFQERRIVSQLYHFVIHPPVQEIDRVVHLGQLQAQPE